jgi:hypothetical protein
MISNYHRSHVIDRVVAALAVPPLGKIPRSTSCVKYISIFSNIKEVPVAIRLKARDILSRPLLRRPS